MKVSRPKDSILGVTISGRALHAVLIAEGPEGPEVIRRFERLRSSSLAEADLPGTGREVVDDGSESDFTIQFGGEAASDLFLTSEFNVEGDSPGGVEATAEAFDVELEDVLEECIAAGHPDPVVAFCIGSSDLHCVELQVAPESAGKSRRKKGDSDENAEVVDRKTLLELLSGQLDSKVDDDRVAFLKMSDADNGLMRQLAVMAKASDPVAATLMGIRDRKSRMPAVQVLDTEVSLYLGLARLALASPARRGGAASDGEGSGGSSHYGTKKTLIVRAGVEDTLVMFMDRDRLIHYESLRSITTYDAPETICSRVLLLQDEYGIGDVHKVLLLSDDREEAIVDSFRVFFAETHVESLRQYLPRLDGEDAEKAATSSVALAVAAALRLTEDEVYNGVFDDVNLLPKKLLRRQVSIPLTWHVFALYGLMFATVIFFVGRYFTVESKVAAQRYKVEQLSMDFAEADGAMLQVRVDSINRALDGYRRALRVLDSLLIGSDKWSRALEQTNNEAAAVKGMWIDSWDPAGAQIVLTGNAMSRDRIVAFAERLEGQIQKLTFSEIRDWPVYTFEMKVPLKMELPEAARYLREQMARYAVGTEAVVQTSADVTPTSN